MPLANLAKKSVVVIFAYAPAGLGHLRVSDALYHGLPDSVTPLLLGAQDKTISVIYRFLSFHPLTRFVMEFFQKGIAESLFTYFYRAVLRAHTRLLHQQFLTILEERLELPERVVVIATHFGLAHQCAAIKTLLEQQTGIRLLLVVQVTDDSPQPIWYIEGADIIFVPSQKTKEKLEAYGKSAGLARAPFFVTPYPVSPRLKTPLSSNRLEARKVQYIYGGDTHSRIAVPVSGAAANIEFSRDVIMQLTGISKQFFFHVVAKDTDYTKSFLADLLSVPQVALHVSEHDRGTIDNYEDVYQRQTIGFEITKPSEQAFKALLKPTQTGGAILLFSQPVGKQEHDNLEFLRVHHLIPKVAETRLLHHLSEKKAVLTETLEGEKLLQDATGWRGIELPKDPEKAALFIIFCLTNGIFRAMSHYMSSHNESLEVSDKGVDLFWKEVSQLLDERLQSGQVPLP